MRTPTILGGVAREPLGKTDWGSLAPMELIGKVPSFDNLLYTRNNLYKPSISRTSSPFAKTQLAKRACETVWDSFADSALLVTKWTSDRAHILLILTGII